MWNASTLCISRRDLSGATPCGVGILAAPALCEPAPAAGRAAPPRQPAKAKSVIQIWMWGGPAHLDTLDPKPAAGYDYCGPFAKPIPTNVAGIEINELLPLLARQADKYSIIRSMTHGVYAHETASYMVQTGRRPGERLLYPCAGAVVSLLKGYNAGYTGLIPPYIVLTQPQGRFSENGFLEERYRPFATGGDPAQARFAVEGVVAPGVTDQRQKDRRELLHNSEHAREGPARTIASLQALDETERQAYELILGDAGKVFDLSQETDEMRDRYGRNTFGQSCLAARRLVERGVPYVTINYEGWDTHRQNFQVMRQKLPQMDKGMATLLQDLSRARPAVEHHRVVGRRVRQNAQSHVGSALEWRAESLGRRLLRPGRRRRLQRRPRGGRVGRQRGSGEGPARISVRSHRQHL